MSKLFFKESVRFLGEFTRDKQAAAGKNASVYGIIPDSAHPRWIIPLKSKKLIISSLALYQPSLIRAKFLKQSAILLTRLGLEALFIRNRIYLKRKDSGVKKLFKDNDLHYAIFTGTEGGHRKVSVQVMDERGAILAYIKVSESEDIDKLLANETKVLWYLSDSGIESGLFPRVIFHGRINGVNVLVLDTLKNRDSTFSRRISAKHIAFLSEVFRKTSKLTRFKESEFAVRLRGRIESGKNYPDGISKYEFAMVRNYLDNNLGDEVLPSGLCHRDFTPWNTFFHEGKLYVFDWEYAEKHYPPLFDILHFIIQDGTLIKKLKPAELLRKITKNQGLIDDYLRSIGVNGFLLNYLILSYLLDISLLYIERMKGEEIDDMTLKLLKTWGGMIDLIMQRKIPGQVKRRSI